MEPIAAVAQQLLLTLHPTRESRVPAEKALRKHSLSPGFTPMLLQIAVDSQYGAPVNLAASLFLKNTVFLHRDKLAPADIEFLREHTIEAIFRSDNAAIIK